MELTPTATAGLSSTAHSIESVTIVVLAHELAHGFTHLGSDTAGYRWSTAAFATSSPIVKEGLAQYYTEMVCAQLQVDCPEAIEAFGTLLMQQPELYTAYKDLSERKSAP